MDSVSVQALNERMDRLADELARINAVLAAGGPNGLAMLANEVSVLHKAVVDSFDGVHATMANEGGALHSAIAEELGTLHNAVAGEVGALHQSFVASLDNVHKTLTANHDAVGEELTNLHRQIAENTTDRIDALSEEVARIHERVAVTQHDNLARLNQWRNAHLVAEFPGDAAALRDAFNGQLSKYEIFLDLVAKRPMRHAIETGTFMGWTTRLLAENFENVATFETSDAYQQKAKAFCANHSNIAFLLDDSERIEEAMERRGIPAGDVDFAYLDAHWHAHCPLRTEIDFVLRAYPNAIIMIDDFEVADDDAYGFDEYPSMTLNMPAIADLIEAHGALAYYPRRRGVLDTSIFFDAIKPRGTLILAPCHMQETLVKSATVRPAAIA
jgi:predicted O-methyltransferase YrrM